MGLECSPSDLVVPVYTIWTSLNPGGKYIGSVRDPKAVLVSWYNFLKTKGIPNATKYESASEFAFDKEAFAEGMLFGSTLWEYYTEYVACLKDPNVLIMVYEDLSKGQLISKSPSGVVQINKNNSSISALPFK